MTSPGPGAAGEAPKTKKGRVAWAAEAEEAPPEAPLIETIPAQPPPGAPPFGYIGLDSVRGSACFASSCFLASSMLPCALFFHPAFVGSDLNSDRGVPIGRAFTRSLCCLLPLIRAGELMSLQKTTDHMCLRGLILAGARGLDS